MPNDPISEHLLTPLMQWGFAGFAAILVTIIVWLVRRLMSLLEKTTGHLIALLEKTNNIIQDNTTAIREMGVLVTDELKLTRGLHDQLLQRPCIARHAAAMASGHDDGD